MKRQVTKARRDRWYGSLRVGRNGYLRFSATTLPGLNHVAIWDHGPTGMNVLSGGLLALMLFTRRGRITSACFDFTTTPERLRGFVKHLRRARGGLDSWVVPALEWTQHCLGGIRLRFPKDARPDLEAVIPELLEECKGLPIAKTWQRTRHYMRQEWAERLRKNPKLINQITAPWLLPDDYKPPEAPPRKRLRKRRRS